MKIVINSQGVLVIERAGLMRNQSCPYTEKSTACGDWCPLFGEPQPQEQDLLQVFLNARCSIDPEYFCPRALLWDAYLEYFKVVKKRIFYQKKLFYAEVGKHFPLITVRGVRGWRGLQLRNTFTQVALGAYTKANTLRICGGITLVGEIEDQRTSLDKYGCTRRDDRLEESWG